MSFLARFHRLVFLSRLVAATWCTKSKATMFSKHNHKKLAWCTPRSVQLQLELEERLGLITGRRPVMLRTQS